MFHRFYMAHNGNMTKGPMFSPALHEILSVFSRYRQRQ
uniref:Uncharacterized protein n=1 Tax=Anguilla anguilla TaxID=7936 RepID=A0A0E9TBB5_ANGAN